MSADGPARAPSGRGPDVTHAQGSQPSSAVVFSNVRADLLEHRHHHVANWLSRQGRTIWIETLGYRTPNVRDVRRLRGEGAGQDASVTMPDVLVASPGTIPVHGSSALYAVNVRRLERRLSALGVRPESTVAWVYLAHPVICGVIERHRWRSIVFDLVDDVSDFVGVHPRVLDAEKYLLRRADVVFASSRALCEKAEGIRGGGVKYIPNGVHADRFAWVPPREQPIRTVTYVGSVFEWFDEGLMADVAEARPQLTFRIVGPVRRPLNRLRRLANVDLHGAIPAHRVPDELARADLCVVPFRDGPLIRSTDPLKVYEALAAGRPVLATNLPQASRFSPAVRIETTAAGWLHAIDQLEKGEWTFDAEGVRARVREQEDWQQRLEAMGHALAAAVAPHT
jgi:glycosyltransferase involved in cell wall biosynthesis